MSADFTLRIEVPPIDIRLHTHGGPETASRAWFAEMFNSLKETIMTSNAELVSQLNDLKQQLDTANATLVKSQGEFTSAITANSANVATLTQKITDLEAVIAAGGSDVPPEVVAAFAGVKTSADTVTTSSNALDALNPDAA